MSRHASSTPHRTVPLLAAGVITLVTLLGACVDEPVPTDPHDHATTVAGSPPFSVSPDLNRDLARLRAALAPYHNRAKSEAEYPGPPAGAPPPADAPGGCWTFTGRGSMGYHYPNPDLLADPAVDLLRPEVLIYEPGPNGHEKLVGLEYVVPLTLEIDGEVVDVPEPAPVLGERFMRNEFLGLWVMHVWLGRPNPDGLFASWNPRGSCRYSTQGVWDWAP